MRISTHVYPAGPVGMLHPHHPAMIPFFFASFIIFPQSWKVGPIMIFIFTLNPSPSWITSASTWIIHSKPKPPNYWMASSPGTFTSVPLQLPIPHPLAQKIFWMLQNPNSLTSDIFPQLLSLWHSSSLLFTRSPSSLSPLLPVLFYTCRHQQAPSHRKKAAVWVIQVIDLCVCFNHFTANGNQMS